MLNYPKYFLLKNMVKYFSYTIVKSLFIKGIPIGLSVFIINLQLRLDQFMLERFLGFSEVGLYALAVRISELWYMIPTLAVSILLPTFVNLSKLDRKQYSLSLEKFFTLAFWSGTIYFLMLIIIGEYVIELLYGEEFRAAYNILVILGGCVVFASQGVVCTIWQVVENKQKYRLYIQIFALVINAFLNICLIPSFGVNGAAYATLLTIASTTWLLPLFFQETRGVTKSMIFSVIFRRIL